MSSLSDISIQFIKGVGPKRMKLFERLGVFSVEDLFYFFPVRYEDRRNIVSIAQLLEGENQAVAGKIISKRSRKSFRSRMHLLEITIDDGSGTLKCVWFNQPYLEKQFQKGQQCFVFGKVDAYQGRLQMSVPEFELIEDDDKLSTNRIVPVYPLTHGLTQKTLRKIFQASIEKYGDQVDDPLPIHVRNKHRLMNLKRSLSSIHFPDDLNLKEEAVRRISFEEFYYFQIATALRRMSVKRTDGFQHDISDSKSLKFISAFPFDLTGAQKRVIREIRDDMQSSKPMLRLLQGDVGSGKTIVAVYGCLMSFFNQKQSAIMAPTEILARQHYLNIIKWVNEGILPKMNVALLVSALKPKEKKQVQKKIETGEIDLVIGTHAVISKGVAFKNLSFVVVDEQHKFGVAQRALLPQKGKNPDMLIMTATPIPRTLSISLYGDLDISVLDEKPKNRGEIQTKKFSSKRDKDVYALVQDQLKKGRQAYIIYPLVDESEKMPLKSAEEMYARFCSKEFKDFQVGLVHGQLKREETEGVMSRFKNHELDLLVSTTVVEVGVDVANANVMVIEHAERFGLAQLHQLRGRVGRGEYDSYCFLIGDPKTDDGKKRLKVIVSTNDGFKIAEEDLKIRGPGFYFGRRQHGFQELKMANPMEQMDLLQKARQDAKVVVEDDPNLSKIENVKTKARIQKYFPGYMDLVQGG